MRECWEINSNRVSGLQHAAREWARLASAAQLAECRQQCEEPRARGASAAIERVKARRVYSRARKTRDEDARLSSAHPPRLHLRDITSPFYRVRPKCFPSQVLLAGVRRRRGDWRIRQSNVQHTKCIDGHSLRDADECARSNNINCVPVGPLSEVFSLNFLLLITADLSVS